MSFLRVSLILLLIISLQKTGWSQSAKTDSLQHELQIERTNNLTMHQRKLVEYTHFYTHKLRGTLASMLGLLLLAEKEEMSESLNDLFEMMQVCTRQLEK